MLMCFGSYRPRPPEPPPLPPVPPAAPLVVPPVVPPPEGPPADPAAPPGLVIDPAPSGPPAPVRPEPPVPGTVESPVFPLELPPLEPGLAPVPAGAPGWAEPIPAWRRAVRARPSPCVHAWPSPLSPAARACWRTSLICLCCSGCREAPWRALGRRSIALSFPLSMENDEESRSTSFTHALASCAMTGRARHVVAIRRTETRSAVRRHMDHLRAKSPPSENPHRPWTFQIRSSNAE